MPGCCMIHTALNEWKIYPYMEKTGSGSQMVLVISFVNIRREILSLHHLWKTAALQWFVFCFVFLRATTYFFTE